MFRYQQTCAACLRNKEWINVRAIWWKQPGGHSFTSLFSPLYIETVTWSHFVNRAIITNISPTKELSSSLPPAQWKMLRLEKETNKSFFWFLLQPLLKHSLWRVLWRFLWSGNSFNFRSFCILSIILLPAHTHDFPIWRLFLSLHFFITTLQWIV